jgi:hypothetical protein
MADEFATLTLHQLPQNLVYLYFPIIPKNVVSLLPKGMSRVQSSTGYAHDYINQPWCELYPEYCIYVQMQ